MLRQLTKAACTIDCSRTRFTKRRRGGMPDVCRRRPPEVVEGLSGIDRVMGSARRPAHDAAPAATSSRDGAGGWGGSGVTSTEHAFFASCSSCTISARSSVSRCCTAMQRSISLCLLASAATSERRTTHIKPALFILASIGKSDFFSRIIDVYIKGNG